MDIFKLISSGKPIGIFGYGVTGKAVEQFCLSKNISHKVFDEHNDQCYKFSENAARECCLIVKSPGFLGSHEWVKLADKSNCPCVTELDLASALWHGKIIAVTGTNGKTTTTEFITHALTTCGFSAVECGNIGAPFIDTKILSTEFNKSDSWAVVEVSSFQADGMKIFRPDFVLWTNFSNDHLDVHEGLAEYFESKASLVRRREKQGKTVKSCFIGPSVSNFGNKLKITDFIDECFVCKNYDALPKNSTLNTKTQRENFSLVQAFWEQNNLPIEKLQEAALSFKMPAHRLQMVKKVNSIDSRTKKPKIVEFWNDSKATNFHAMAGALSSFKKRVILISGGKSKNEPFEDFLEAIGHDVKILLLIGETAQSIYNYLQNKLSIPVEIFMKNSSSQEAMNIVVRRAYELAQNGDIVLLSPGFSSLDWFKDYAERGNAFEASVLCLSSANK